MKKKVKEYPTLIPTNVSTPKLIFKEEYSPTIHLNEVSKNIGYQGRLQSLVESFTRQATRWWGTHQFDFSVGQQHRHTLSNGLAVKN